MYDIKNTFLYEVFDDYRNASDEEKDVVFKEFCILLWKIGGKPQKYRTSFKYVVNDSMPDGEIKEVFKKYSEVTYVTYNSSTKKSSSWNLLRQKINNIFINMCDQDICTKRDYLNELSTAKRLYYRWIKNEMTLSVSELENQIQKSHQNANELFDKYKKQKIQITWGEYKELITTFVRRCFDNYIPIDEYEKKDEFILDIDYWTEDNYVIKYLGKSLNGYMHNYEKEYFGSYHKGANDNRKYVRCEKCGNLFLSTNKRKKLCKECSQYKPMGTKTITCVDCGKEFEVDGVVKKQLRCNECQSVRDKIVKSQINKKYYNKRKNN